MTDRMSPDREPPLSPVSDADTLVKVCPVCGARYPAADKFCANDGQPLRDTQPQADPLIGTVVGDRYFVQRRLGHGGMGVVYLAEHVRIGRKVAVKVLLPEYANNADALARFHREAANLSRVNHPNVASLFDYGESAGGLLYLAMEYIDGASLSEVLTRETRLPVGRVAGILAQVAAALHAAHGLGIVHRDLKPDNIIVTRSPNDVEVVKVVDFGIARAVKETAQKVTETGAVIGTLAYMSPEQLGGEEVDSRSDLYSLALVTYVLLTGKLPFRSDSQKAILERLSASPASLAALAPGTDWPVALQFALNRALQADRTQRQGSTQQFAREVIDALEAWRPGVISPLVRALGSLGQDVAATLSPDVIVRHATPDRLPLPVEATGKRPRRWTKPAVGSAVGILALGAAIATWYESAPKAVNPVDSAEFQTSGALTVGKSESLSVSSIRTDSAVPPTTASAPGVRVATPSPERVRSREGRVDAQTPGPVVPRQDPTRPITSPPPPDPSPATTGNSLSPDSSANRTDPVSAPVPAPATPSTGLVQIGTHESGVVLIVNDRADGPLTRLGLIRVPVGTVRLRLRAEQCQDWDSTVTVRGGDTVRIGFRRPQC